jgi:hypothetical protein
VHLDGLAFRKSRHFTALLIVLSKQSAVWPGSAFSPMPCIEGQLSQVFSVGFDFLWLLPLFFEELQLGQQCFIRIIGLGRVPSLLTHRVLPLEKYVRRTRVPMKAALKFLAFRLSHG